MDELGGEGPTSAVLGHVSTRTLTRVLLSVLAGGLCGVVVTCGVLVLGGGDRTTAARPAPPRPAASAQGAGEAARLGESAEQRSRHRAREVLRRWDAARARAWTSSDPAVLARLYTRRSVAGRRDVAMLRTWTGRGARVTELTTQVLRLQVLVDRARRLELVVTDRVARVEVSGAGGTRTLPRDRASTRRIVLVRTAGRWQVASVSPARPARS